jgi:hypothetical protein
MGMYDYTRGWLKGDCPYCGKADKFGIQLDLNKANCFVCGKHGTVIKSLMETSGTDNYHELLNLLKTDTILNYSEFETKPLDESFAELPEGFVPLNYKKGGKLGQMVNYYLSHTRGLDTNALSRKGFGYINSGRMFGYLVMPFYANNKLVYYHTRNLWGKGPKFDNPTVDEVGIGKSLIMYNRDSLWLYDRVFLVESVLNAETLGETACATGGKKISSYQINTIIKSPVNRVIILLDPDGYVDALKVAMTLSDYKRVKVCLLPGDADVNDLGRRKVLNLVHKTHYQPYSELVKLKHKAEYDERSIITY